MKFGADGSVEHHWNCNASGSYNHLSDTYISFCLRVGKAFGLYKEVISWTHDRNCFSPCQPHSKYTTCRLPSSQINRISCPICHPIFDLVNYYLIYSFDRALITETNDISSKCILSPYYFLHPTPTKAKPNLPSP